MRAARLFYILVVLAAIQTTAQADIARVTFSGVINAARGDVPADIVAGQTPFWGSLTINTGATDRSRRPDLGDYRHALISTELIVGNYDLSQDVFSKTLVHDNFDRVSFAGRPDLSTFGGRTLKKARLQLTDSTRDVLSGDALTQLLGLSLDALDSYRGAVLTLKGRGDFSRFKVSGHVFSMNVSTVPAPGAALLAVAGFALVGLTRRRR